MLTLSAFDVRMPSMWWANSEGTAVRLLAPKGYHLVEPKQGGWTLIEELLCGMYGTQADLLLARLKLDYEALRDGRIDCGQALITVGPPDCGKTLVREHVFVPILGGRAAKA